ncbi:hypothetical protein UYO_0700 [Lachnospiraceae bacterium JC7]|nr:hypothetical protein UYO_0700 [Lachnospiraceae bacterium JC7]
MDSKDLFRKKSLENISNPDQINDYIKISSPSVWLILIAILMVLIGSIIWGVFGVITVNTPEGVQYIAPIGYLLH